MSSNDWIRPIHRWTSIVFTVAVVINFVAVGLDSQAVWVGLLALFPLAVLLFSGLYLFVLPHAARWRRGGTIAVPEKQRQEAGATNALSAKEVP